MFLRKRRGQQWNKDSTGQAYIEFAMIVPVALILLAGVLFFGRMLYLKIALDMASYSGARTAVEALDQAAGISQGWEAAYNTLNGFHISAASAQIVVTPMGAWGREQQVCCRVTYNLAVGDFPFTEAFFSGSSISLGSTTCSRVAPLRSGW